MSGRTALDIADDLEKFGQGWLDAVAMLRHQHAEIARLQANMTAMTLERDIRVMTEARNAELHAEIARLTEERVAAIAAAVAAEREAISAQLLELADELGYGSSWWGPPGGLLLRAADMVSARAKQ